MKRLPVLALGFTLLAGPALAVEPMPLYVKARNTHLKATSKPTAKTVAVLQPGDQVTFLGREANTPWCRVEHAAGSKKVKGVIFQASLTASAPTKELSASGAGGALDPQAFAASGAAVKALGPGAIDYGKGDAKLADHVASLEALEALSATVDESVIAKAVKQKKLNPVVGTAAAGGAK